MEKGEIRINTENIFPIIKKAVYSDHEIFLRELVSNGVDAISKRRMASMAGDCENTEEAQVKITINREKNTITISDNGIGMTDEEIKFSILLKLFILPFIVFLISKFLNFDFYQSSAVVLQAGTPTAISTILMAEAYDVKQKIASKILFTTTLISIITIPLLKMLMTALNKKHD